MRTLRTVCAFVAVAAPGSPGCRPSPKSDLPVRAASEAGEDALPSLTAAQRRADFEQMWAFVDATYPFFDEKATDWAKVKAQLLPRAEAAADDLAFMHVLEDALDQLYDPHCMLGTNAGDSWRPVPGDVWLEEGDGGVRITAVERGSAGQAAGVLLGHHVVEIDGRPIADAIALRYPSTLPRGNAQARAWALLSAAAGLHNARHRITVLEGSKRREIEWASGGTDRPVVEARKIEEGIGYIAVSTFADETVVSEFDKALEGLRESKAILIDVRSNRGGDTMYAVPMMGRFITEVLPYAKMTRRSGETWVESVEPRGSWAYEGDVFVLVNRFSISMAEGFAMGMQGMKRAKIVGTRMAGLGAATARVELEHSKIPVQISAEPVFHVDGTPRWKMVPDFGVNVVATAEAGVPDPILRVAVDTAHHATNCEGCGHTKCEGGCCRNAGWISCRVDGRDKRCVNYTACDARCCPQVD